MGPSNLRTDTCQKQCICVTLCSIASKLPGAKNAPLACYEEINSHQDRFGNCGNQLLDGYQPCSWL